MLTKVMNSVFGSRNDRVLRRMDASVQVINGLELSMQRLTDQALADKTLEFKARLADGQSLEDLLPEAFAVVREAAFRTLGLRPFDVQLIGGMVLHAGNIAEMRTGEGKTLVATLPAYLNALSGLSVHVVTVNDYLARRDSEWMMPVFKFLGMSVGVIYPDMPHEDKRQAYSSDIVYGTNNEFGFDYLRDNMAFDLEHKVQRTLNFAIVDEVDSILIDEARTPLIISGEAEDSSELYKKINTIIPSLVMQQGPDDLLGDYTKDEKQKQAYLTEHGHQTIEERLIAEGLLAVDESLYHSSNILLMHHVMAALRAHVMYNRNVDYIVQQDQVMIVDEHTGRTMPGRRWSDGLHQAMEAKEHVNIQNENRTLASITFQNFFRLYKKLSGMTGTADTEAYEFQQIYNLEVIVIPTNKEMRRIDQSDLIYLTQEDKYNAIIEDVRACVERKQPVLVGTASIEASEVLSELLKKARIKHQVLNAKFHEKEAQIIAEAGRPGAVTIATNMAGRGTDIVLGGRLDSDNPEEISNEEWKQRNAAVLAAGGLRIIGSERHESRRIDNQLRGRSGRQGDPGHTRFYLSLEDPLMRIFASERVSMMMRRLGMQPGEPIEHSLVTKAIENAQRKLEGHHFDVRKQLLEYDNVANEQRKVLYTQRAAVLAMPDLSNSIDEMRLEVIQALVDRYLPPQTLDDQWDVEALTQLLKDDLALDAPIDDWIDQDPTLNTDPIASKLYIMCQEKSDARLQNISPEETIQFQRSVILENMDNHWREHLSSMDHLRQGIHLRGYAQKDPKQEYKREAFTLFSMMLDDMRYEIVRRFATLTLQSADQVEQVSMQRHAEFSMQPMNTTHDDNINTLEGDMTNVVSFDRGSSKVGRNEPCWCGSQEKYKNCHGKLS